MPQSTNAIASAVEWVEHLLSGSIATVIAVLAVASIGFLMLQGRIDLYRAGRVVIGCFIVFSASTIAQGLISGVTGGPSVDMAVAGPLPAPPPLEVEPVPQADPYAGAALIR